MQLNTGMVDWLTLTSFSEFDYQEWLSIAHSLGQPVEKTKRLQYGGLQSGGVFVGQAEQYSQGARRRHYMLQASGEVADWVAQVTPRFHEERCTRIDLQVTVRRPAGYDSRSVFDQLRAWEAEGRRRQVSIVQSGDDLDTIYIGSRSSDRFTRLYVKALVDGHALRFEVEFKGDHADHVYNTLANRGASPRAFLIGELKAMPELTEGHFKTFLDTLGYHGLRSRPERAYAQTGTLRWLKSQVDPAILRAMNDHESGPMVRQLVRKWAQAADEIDNTHR